MSPAPQIPPLVSIISLAITPVASADVVTGAKAVASSSSEIEKICGIRIDLEHTDACQLENTGDFAGITESALAANERIEEEQARLDLMQPNNHVESFKPRGQDCGIPIWLAHSIIGGSTTFTHSYPRPSAPAWLAFGSDR